MAIAVPPQLTIITPRRWVPEPLAAEIRAYRPRTGFGGLIKTSLAYLPPELAQDVLDRLRAIVVIESSLALVHTHYDARLERFVTEDHGVVSRKLVTDNGVARIVDAFDNTVTDADTRYHGLGTGSTAEAAADSALVTELTTEYNPNSTRATGTFSQPSANISRSVATNTVDASAAVVEHGVLSQAATGGGVLLDRSVFSVINLASADSLQSTYSLSLVSGG